jgi:hypothetical protein
MNNVHGTHGTASIVENPFLGLVQVVSRDFLVQFGDNEVHHRTGVVAMSLDGARGEVVQLLGIEDVELLKASIEVAVQRGEDGHEDRKKTEFAHGEAAAAAGTLAGRICVLGGGFRGHGAGCNVEQ